MSKYFAEIRSKGEKITKWLRGESRRKIVSTEIVLREVFEVLSEHYYAGSLLKFRVHLSSLSPDELRTKPV